MFNSSFQYLHNRKGNSNVVMLNQVLQTGFCFVYHNETMLIFVFLFVSGRTYFMHLKI